ncbi:MAG: hypothetical protein WKF96_02870 [Solirubrobacteraceae bacterium]
MSFNFENLTPLDFRQTLDLLVVWEGAQVSVISMPQAPGEPMSHTQTVMAGVLGRLQMVDNAIDPDVESVAAFSIGPTPPNGFYLSPAGFRLSQPLPGRAAIRIDFRHNYSIQVDMIGDVRSRMVSEQPG